MSDTAAANTGSTQTGAADAQILADDASFAETFGLSDPTPPQASPPPAASAASPQTGAAPKPAPVAVSGDADTGAATADDGTESEEPEAVVADGFTQDAEGNWHRPDGTFASAQEIAAMEAGEALPERPAADAVADPVAEPAPEGEPAKEPLAQFAAYQNGEEVEVPEGLVLKFTAAGKEREVSLDHAVKLAQVGFYNEEREQRIRAEKEHVTAVAAQLQAAQQMYQEIEERAQALNDWYEELLRDPENYYAAKEKYDEANTPEARLQRTEEELAAYQAGTHPALQHTQGPAQATPNDGGATQFVATLAQRMEAIAVQHPSVPFEDIYGRFSYLTAPLLESGRIPPERFTDVAMLVMNELVPWVQSRHEAAQATKQQAETTAQEQERLKKQLSLQKRSVARAIAPVGGAGKSGARPATPKPTERAEDANNRILDEIFSA